MLSGRYPSDEFAELRPRLTWDRLQHTGSTAREGAKRVAIINGGTIPDRGLYGVFLAGERGPGARVGELDEEMVFESRVGETFLLGASTWRIEEITHDRVLVSPAPGEPGKMPFWKGDAAGRPLELGPRHRRAGAHAAADAAGRGGRTARARPRSRPAGGREPAPLPRRSGQRRRRRARRPHDPHRAVPRRARRLADLRALPVRRPHPRAVGDGGRRARASAKPASTSRRCGPTTGSWCGSRRRTSRRIRSCCCRLPTKSRRSSCGSLARRRCSRRSSARPPPGRCCCRNAGPAAAARCGSSASAPPICWRVASRFGSFPMLLETYRECLRDVFDMPALVDTLRRIETPEIRVGDRRLDDGRRRLPRRCCSATSPTISTTATRRWPSGARRRWRSIRRSCASCSATPSCASCSTPTRSTTSSGSCSSSTKIAARAVGRRRPRPAAAARRSDGEEIAARSRDSTRAAARRDLTRDAARDPRQHRRRAAGHPGRGRGRYRDALGVPLPPGLPESLLEPAPHAARDLARRYARTHGPFTTTEFAARYGLGRATAEALLKELVGRRAACSRASSGRAGSGREWCDPDVLQIAAAPLAREAAPRGRAGRASGARPADHELAGRRPAARRDSMRCSTRSTPAGRAAVRVDPRDRDPAGADRGLQPGRSRRAHRRRRGRVGGPRAARRARRPAGALSDRSPGAAARVRRRSRSSRRASSAILDHLERNGASFFAALHEAAGGGYPGETVDALWDPRLARRAHERHVPRAARVHAAARATQRRKPRSPPATSPATPAVPQPPASRRRSAEGRWSLVGERIGGDGAPTESVDRAGAAAALALRRAHARSGGRGRHPGGFSARLRRAESDGGCRADPPRLLRERPRRDAVRAAGGARSAAVAARTRPTSPRSSCSPPTDPANPYGTISKWPASSDGERRRGRGPTRSVGSLVVLVNGALARLHQPRRPTAAGVPARGRAGAIDRSRALAASRAARRGAGRWRS